MDIQKIDIEFSVCKVDDYLNINLNNDFVFIEKTDEENSLVCPTKDVPTKVIVREDGWKSFRIKGILDFSLIGILANISKILAEHNISIFVISTYNTDYIFIKYEFYQKAIEIFKDNGYNII